MKNLKIKYLHDCLLMEDILVIGDLHIGYDSMFNGKAIFPGMQLEIIIEKLEGVFDFLKKEKIDVKKIILLGDVKHDFGEITDIEWRETLKFLDYLKNKGKKIIVVKGNHDTKLNPILRKKGINMKDFYVVEVGGGGDGKKVCFFHGNKLFEQCLDNNNKVLVFGHIHPAITLYDEYKSEKFKCFLKGKWKKKDVYILPSFSTSSLGYNLNDLREGKGFHNKVHKVFNQVPNRVPNKIIEKFEVIIYNNKEKKEYMFGKLRGLI